MTEEIFKEKVQKMNELIKNTGIEMEQKPEKDHDFSFLEEANQKQESVMAKNLKRRIKPYTSSRIKREIFSQTFLILVLKVKILQIITLGLTRKLCLLKMSIHFR